MKARTRRVHIVAQVADGGETILNTEYEIKFKYNGKTKLLFVTAFPNLAEDIVLGISTLVSLGLKLSLAGKEIKPGNRISEIYSNSSIQGIRTLNPNEESELKNFLQKELQIFKDLPQTTATVGEHHIRMKHERPITARYIPRNPAMQSVIDKELDQLLAADQIEPSKSPYSAPIVLVKKKRR